MYKTITATYGKSPFSPSFLHTVLQEKQKYKIKLLIANFFFFLSFFYLSSTSENPV